VEPEPELAGGGLKAANRGGGAARPSWGPGVFRFEQGRFGGVMGVLRWDRRLPFLIRVGLPAVLALGFLFVIARSRGWLDRSPWNKALAEYREQVALYRFAQAAEGIRNVRLIGAYYKPAEEVAEKRAQLMFDWKNSLID